MAESIQVYGPTQIKVDGTLLGYTANGAEITKEASFLNVPGDQNGGDDGPPIDVQILGEIARVRVELTKYDDTIASVLESRVANGTGGVPPTPGTLMFTDTKTRSLVLQGTTRTLTFPRAFPRGNVEVNKGTKFSRKIFEFECHENADGVLYTET